MNISRGGHPIPSSFHDRTYATKVAALHVAHAYCDAVLEVVPPLTNADMRTLQRRNRVCGAMPGVHYPAPIGNRPAY